MRRTCQTKETPALFQTLQSTLLSSYQKKILQELFSGKKKPPRYLIKLVYASAYILPTISRVMKPASRTPRVALPENPELALSDMAPSQQVCPLGGLSRTLGATPYMYITGRQSGSPQIAGLEMRKKITLAALREPN